VKVRENDLKERKSSKQAGHCIYQQVIDKGIRTGQFDNLSKFTEVRNFQVFAEG
jgi:hypothetical protein